MLLNKSRRTVLRFAAATVAGVLLFGGWQSLAQTTNPTTNASASAHTNLPEGKIAALEAEMKTAVQQVNKIINQPVARLPRRPGMRVSEFKPGWFHEGANKPDFNNVDVRTTRETPYDQYDYV